jgi:hypothetical protein
MGGLELCADGVSALVSVTPNLQPNMLWLCLGILPVIALADLRSICVRAPYNFDSFRHLARQSQLLPMKTLGPLQKVRTLRSAFTNSL